MPRKISKARIEALEGKFGTQKALASHLGVSTRFLRYMKTGERTSVKVSGKMQDDYKKAALEAGYKNVKMARPARVEKYFREPKIHEVKAKFEKHVIPKYRVSTGKKGRKYFIFATAFMPPEIEYGGTTAFRGETARVVTRLVGVMTAAQFKKDFKNIKNQVSERTKKEYGFSPMGLEFFRNKKPVR